MKKEQLERGYGLRCGQRIEDAEGIMYLICNDLSGNVSILRLRDSVLFSGVEARYLIEDIAKSLYFQQNKDSRDSGFIPHGGLTNVFAKSDN